MIVEHCASGCCFWPACLHCSIACGSSGRPRVCRQQVNSRNLHLTGGTASGRRVMHDSQVVSHAQQPWKLAYGVKSSRSLTAPYGRRTLPTCSGLWSSGQL